MAGHASTADCQNVLHFGFVPSLLVPTECKRSQLTESARGQLCNMHNMPITPRAKYFARREVIRGGYSRFILLPLAKWSHVPFFFRTLALLGARFCKVLSPTVRGWVLSLSLLSAAVESTHYPPGMLNTFQKRWAPSSTGAGINDAATD